ncbi:hypothetical protein [Pararhodobacter zhoushanensis]|uniref:hypothetical protein n=1 Tax=Pararhodobacter zhoushanensis TaxID=2479545 RepID=UPI000F8D347F|nr:hypothetical protein [Pararhodobacter zhoushanensis]
MKILKIENGNGFFVEKSTGDWKKIDEIDKAGLLSLLDTFLSEDVEMDSPEDNHLANEVHVIVYQHILNKLQSLSESKSSFKDDSERRYFEEISKYSSA